MLPAISLTSALAQKGPVTKNGVRKALRNKVLSGKAIISEIQLYGVDFKLEVADKEEFRRLGKHLGRKGLDGLFAAIERNYRVDAALIHGQKNNNVESNNSSQDQIIKLTHEIEAARKNLPGRPQVATEPFARRIRTENGVVTECLNPPIRATLGYWPVTFSTTAEDCHIYSLVDARLARDDQYYSKNKEEWERGVTAHYKDEVYVSIYVNNGAADFHGQYDPTIAVAKNVVISTKTDTLTGSTHYIEVTASGDNIDTVYGRIKINTNPNERIEIVPRSGQIRNFMTDRILANGFEMGNNRIGVGDLKPFFQESLFIRYTIRIVV
jgi:hypothetical protein